MSKFQHLVKQVGTLLEDVGEIAMVILGLCMICFIGVELWQLVQLTPLFNGNHSFTTIIEDVILFFILFEFLAMAATALRHHGHISADFLINLGITALLRGLIAEHAAPLSNLLTSLAILVLILGDIALHQFGNRENDNDK